MSNIFSNTIALIIIGILVVAGFIWILGNTNLSSRSKVLIVVALVVSGLILYATVIPGASLVSNLAGVSLLRWFIAGIVMAFGIWLVYRSPAAGPAAGRHTTAPHGTVIILLALLFGIYFDNFAPYLTSSALDLAGFRYIITFGLGGLGVYLALATKNKAAGIFLIILGVAFWFAVPFLSSTLFEKIWATGRDCRRGSWDWEEA